MKEGTLVKNKKSGVMGVVVGDPFGCCDGSEVPVVCNGSTAYHGTDPADLEVIGPEKAKADLEKCGAGKGEECCIFLVVGPAGPECQRFGPMRNTLIFRTMKSKREPNLLYPECQFK